MRWTHATRSGDHRGARSSARALPIGCSSSSCVAADPGGGSREDCAGVKVVEAAEQGVGGEGEFEDDQAAAGAEDAVELADGGGGVGDVADAEGDGDDVGGGVGEGEGEGVAVD